MRNQSYQIHQKWCILRIELSFLIRCLHSFISSVFGCVLVLLEPFPYLSFGSFHSLSSISSVFGRVLVLLELESVDHGLYLLLARYVIKISCFLHESSIVYRYIFDMIWGMKKGRVIFIYGCLIIYLVMWYDNFQRHYAWSRSDSCQYRYILHEIALRQG